MCGVVAIPKLGTYSASKWAHEALSEVLATETTTFGITVTLVEPGLYGQLTRPLRVHIER
jgi:short-subunit dehydrogenase